MPQSETIVIWLCKWCCNRSVIIFAFDVTIRSKKGIPIMTWHITLLIILQRSINNLYKNAICVVCKNMLHLPLSVNINVEELFC
jgi:hypothetical protein